jgi:nitrate reductase gamma subunit
MTAVEVTRILAIVGLVLCLLGIALRLRDIMDRPYKQDLSRPRGNIRRGVLYAFTLGMAPWEKESTRRHWLAYFRGILFHVGIFMAFAVLLASPWLAIIPKPFMWLAMLVTAAGAVFGLAGIVMRLTEEDTRVLSLPDDYFSVFLSSLFVALAFLTLLVPLVLPVFYVIAAVVLVYIPFSKIRHCVYFFYSKFFFGLSFGRRGVIGQPDGKYAD